MGAAREGVRGREHTKSLAIALVDEVRRLARRAGDLLVARGTLARAEDVVLLTGPELRAALRGAPVSRALLARRRRRLDGAARLPAPRDVDLDAPGEETPDAMRWRGVGVSGGIGVGPARVAGAGEMPRLAGGEVLVAPVLDAAMGPALSAAAGAVIEIGGVLSHGAVVARELGIPCVVDVRGATAAIRDGERLLVDGGTGEVRRLADERGGDGAPPEEAPLVPASAEDEAFHVLEDHPRARESVYVNAQDAASGLCLVASAGVRRGARGEALVALGMPDGRVLFGLELERARIDGASIRVGRFEAAGAPFALRFEGRLSVHEPESFPPGPVPLLLAPRTAEVRLELRLAPTTPAIEFARTLPEELRALLTPLGAHHVEQSGRWTGRIDVFGQAWTFDGTGSRDHSWGRREWDAAEWWRLFTFRLGDDLAVHALSVQVNGRRVDGGFLWRDGRAARLARVLYAPRTDGTSFDLEVTPATGPALRVVGRVRRRLTVPVDPERRLGPHLAGRPWRLRLHERFADYAGEGRRGHGMAEITARSS